jgi:hypothetical protein
MSNVVQSKSEELIVIYSEGKLNEDVFISLNSN